MSHTPRFFAVLVVLLSILFVVAACGGSSDDATGARGDDDDFSPPPATDDDDDNDTSGDDDVSPDDDDTSPDDDDTSPDDDDDDDDDDDTTPPIPGRPYAEINSPEHNGVYTTFTISIDADIFEVDTPGDITVFMDDTNVTAALTVTATKVSGSLTSPVGGWHTLRIDMVNDEGPGSDRARFLIDKPYIQITKPEAGRETNMLPVVVQGLYGNIDAATLVAKLDGNDITGSLDVFSGEIDGELSGVAEGNHLLVFTAETSRREQIEVQVPFSLVLLPPHFVVSTSAQVINSGDTVDVSYTFYDESGHDITGSVTVDLSTEPITGTVISDDEVTFYAAGVFQVLAGTFYNSTYYEGSAVVFVRSAEAFEIDLTLSDYDVVAGEPMTASWVVTDEDGDEIPDAPVGFLFSPAVGVTLDLPSITLTKAGLTYVTAHVLGTGVFDTEVVDVSPADPYQLFVACEPPTIAEGETVECFVEVIDEFDNPVPGEPYTYEVTPPVGITINGDEITFDDAGYFVITATASNFPAMSDNAVVQVTAETTPGIEIVTPDRALYTQDPTVSVSGYIYDVDFLSDDVTVTMNGVPIYFDWQTGDFGPEIYTLANGLNIIELVVVADEGGPGEQTARASTSVLYAADEWPNGAMIEDAVGLRITENGFDDLEGLIEAYIADVDFEEIIYSQNPIFNERLEVWGVTLASARATVTGVAYDPPQVYFDAAAAAIGTSAQMTNIVLDFQVTGTILGIGYSISGDVSVNAVDLDTFTFVYLNAETGQITIDMDQFAVTLTGFNMDISGFPDELEDLFQDTISDAIEDAANAALYAMIPPLLQEVFNNIQLEFDIPMGDVDFSFRALPAVLDFDDVGMETWMDAEISASHYDPAVRPFNGSIRTAGSRPQMGATTVPNVGEPYGMGVALADDVLNRLLYELYRTGTLHMDVDDAINACSPVFYLLLPQICDAYGTGPGDTVNVDVKIRPQLPPVMLRSNGKAGTIGSDIQFGDMFIYLYADGPSGSEPVLTIAVSATIPTDISHEWASNSFTFTFGAVTAVADTISNPLAMPEGLFEGIAPMLVELVLPILDDFLGSIELPTFEVGDQTYALQIAHILLIGPGQDFLAAYGALDEVVE
jgi:hypothetical protein